MHKIIKVFIILLLTGACVNSAQVSIENLKCEYLSNPISIDVENPRFEWKLISEQQDVQQIAYQILVASSLSKLDKDVGNIWTVKELDRIDPYKLNLMENHWKVVKSIFGK